jgi:CRP-like cAMP-binding protein
MPNQEQEHFLSRSKGDDSSAAHRKNGDSGEATAVGRPRLFSGILPSDYAAICRVACVKHFSRGEMLHLEGDAIERVLLLTSGSVKITKLGQAGEEVILRLTVPGEVLGAVDLFSCGVHGATARAFRACRALVWDKRVFEGLVKRFPVLHQNMVGILDERLRELEDRFREVATERVGPRVALQLLRLLKTIGRPLNGECHGCTKTCRSSELPKTTGEPVDEGGTVSLSREELGQMTGTTLFTVSRLLSAWEARGVVRPCREAVAICDVQSLRAIAQEI